MNMTDDHTLSLLKQASVFIRSPDNSGSGYLVAPQRIGTAYHVVKSWQPGRRYEVLVGVGEERRPCKAWLVDSNLEADAALLGFDEAIGAQPLTVAETEPTAGAHWQCYGYTALTNRQRQNAPQGLPLAGEIVDAHVEGGPLLLSSADIGAGNASPLHGFSGSPVVVDGKLVGHLIRHIGDRDDPMRAAYGYVYACGIRAVLALLNAERAQAAEAEVITRDALTPLTFRDPDALYVLVVSPPGAAPADSLDLGDQAQLAWEHDRPRIAAAVNRYRQGLRLPPLSSAGANEGLVVVTLGVEQALASKAALRTAVQALCRCEAALFDLTGYDPGVLFLLGIRAVARRGVTVTTIGDQYTLGSTVPLPFNLQLLNMASHSKAQLKRGEGRPHELIGGKLVSGFMQLTDLPHYLDLPAYESVRHLGIGSAAHKPIRYTEKVLVLCPFGEAYSKRNWDLYIGLALEGKLKAHARRATPPEEANLRVERLLDVRTPRLVEQSLYEAIRLTDLCIIDWTGLRANVMFEAGVRLATNALGAVHIFDADSPEPPPHIVGLMEMLRPVRYRCAPGGVNYDEMIRRFDTSLSDYREGRRNDVFDAVGAAIDLTSQSVALPLVDELTRSANLLSGDDEESVGISPVLFSEVNKELAETVGRAAAERRLAAWLFLSHRFTATEIVGDGLLLEQFELLSAQVRRWARKAHRDDLVNQVKSFEATVKAASSHVGAKE